MCTVRQRQKGFSKKPKMVPVTVCIRVSIKSTLCTICTVRVFDFNPKIYIISSKPSSFLALGGTNVPNEIFRVFSFNVLYV